MAADHHLEGPANGPERPARGAPSSTHDPEWAQPSASHDSPVRRLPAVDALLRHPGVAGLHAEFPRSELLAAARALLERWREALRNGRAPAAPDIRTLARELHEELYRRQQPSLRRVINATGIVLHTGLGRAPLADEALQAILDTAGGYCNLELDLRSGDRGDRHAHVRELLCELTGAEDALIVNNNAAGTLLALAGLAGGREVLIARGQLVEIGGSYRLPEIMAAAGCRMIEVGTTNRTRLRDYEQALTERTAALMRVHPSNYRIIGFVEETSAAELAALARAHGLVFLDDLGSGLLTPHGGWDEPSVDASLRSGADLVLFSGDKLLGGPQAGILAGAAARLASLRVHPLARAVRPDKLTLAALEATLRLYRDPATLAERLPVLRLLSATEGELRARAEGLAERLVHGLPGVCVTSSPDVSYAGGGALPTLPLTTWTVRLGGAVPSAAVLAAALRRGSPAILARLHDDQLIFDLRTIRPDEVEAIVPAVLAAWVEVRDAAT